MGCRYGKLRCRHVQRPRTFEDFTITWGTTEREVSRVLEDLQNRGKLFKLEDGAKATVTDMVPL